jgi:hypothetical protein
MNCNTEQDFLHSLMSDISQAVACTAKCHRPQSSHKLLKVSKLEAQLQIDVSIAFAFHTYSQMSSMVPELASK